VGAENSATELLALADLLDRLPREQGLPIQVSILAAVGALLVESGAPYKFWMGAAPLFTEDYVC
jgi:hypothetical protein